MESPGMRSSTNSVHHGVNECMLTVRIRGMLSTITMKKHETGHDLVEEVLKLYKKNHVLVPLKTDDCLGVLNIRTLRFMRLNNKVFDQVTSDLLWVITYEEWQQHRKGLEFPLPVTRRTGILVPQHPSGLSKEKLSEFVEEYENYTGGFSNLRDEDGHLLDAVDGIETRINDVLRSSSKSPSRRSNALDGLDGSGRKKLGGSNTKNNPHTTPSGGSHSNSTPQSASYMEATTPFIRRPNQLRHKRAMMMRGSSSDGEEEDKDGDSDNDIIKAATVATIPSRTPQTTGKRPSVVKSVTLADLGSHHLSSESEEEDGEEQGYGRGDVVRGSKSPLMTTATSTSPRSALKSSSSSSLSSMPSGAPISLQIVPGGPKSSSGISSLRDMMVADSNNKQQSVLVAIPRDRLKNLRDVKSTTLNTAVVLPDYSAVVTDLLAAQTAQQQQSQQLSELQAKVKFYEQKLEHETKAAEINLASLHAEHKSRVDELRAEHTDVVMGLRLEHTESLVEAQSQIATVTDAHQNALRANENSTDERVTSLETILLEERTRRHAAMEEMRVKHRAELEKVQAAKEEAVDKVAKKCESLHAEKRSLESRLGEVTAQHQLAMDAVKQNMESQQSMLLDSSKMTHSAQKASLRDRLAAMEEQLEQERATAEEKLSFLSSRSEEQISTLQHLLKEEREAGAQALQAHRLAAEEQLLSLREHEDDSIEHKLKVAQEQLLSEREVAEGKLRNSAQEHALAMTAARQAADERYQMSHQHHQEALEALKQSSAERIDAIKHQLEEERVAAQGKVKLMLERHEQDMQSLRATEDVSRQTLLENHRHKESIARTQQDELLQRVDSVRKQGDAKLAAAEQEHKQALAKERDRSDSQLANVQGLHLSELQSLGDAHARRLELAADSQREHMQRAADAEERYQSAVEEHKQALEVYKSEVKTRQAEMAEAHRAALKEREQASILQDDRALKREKELRDAHQNAEDAHDEEINKLKQRNARLNEALQEAKRQQQSMIDAVAEPLRRKVEGQEIALQHLKDEHKVDIIHILDDAEEKHGKMVTALKTEHASALDTLRFAHAEATSSLAAREAKIEKLVRQHEEENAVTLAAHEKRLALAQERLDVTESTFAEVKSELQSKVHRANASVEQSKKECADKESELVAATAQVHSLEGLLATQKQVSTAHEAEHKHAEDRCRKLQQQLESSRETAEDTRALLTKSYEERLFALQTQLSEERESTGAKMAALVSSHSESMRSLQQTEADRRHAEQEQHQQHVERLKASLESHLEQERDDAMRKHSHLGDKHESTMADVRALFDAQLQQERASNETEAAAYEKRIAILESSAQQEAKALQSSFAVQMDSLRAEHEHAMKAHYRESGQNSDEAVRRINEECEARVAALETALEQQKDAFATAEAEYDEQLSFIKKQMLDATEAEDTALISVTSPAARARFEGGGGGVNTSVVSHLSVDDDDDEDEDNSVVETDEGSGDESGHGSPGGGRGAWATVPTPGKAAGGGGGGGGHRNTVRGGEGLFTPTAASGSGKDSDSLLDNALLRQAELEKLVAELQDSLAAAGGSKRVTFMSSGGGDSVAEEEGEVTEAETAETAEAGAGETCVIAKKLALAQKQKWRTEVQRDALELKIRVIERRYQAMTTSLETKIEHLEGMHSRAKDVIRADYEEKLQNHNRMKLKEVDDHVARHEREKEALRLSHEMALDTKHRELTRGHEESLNEHTKALFSSQQSWEEERGRLTRALTDAEEENKNLVAAVEEFRIMLLTGKKYTSAAAGGGDTTDAATAAAAAVSATATPNRRNDQYTNLFRWVTDSTEDPAEKLLTRTSPSPFRIQRWKSAQNTALRLADERRGRGESVDEEEIAERAALEYYSALARKDGGVDMRSYDPGASLEAVSGEQQEAYERGLALPAIYDNNNIDSYGDSTTGGGGDMMMVNPMKQAAGAGGPSSSSSSSSSPRAGKLTSKEMLVLSVEEEIEQARAESSTLQAELQRLTAENVRLSGVEAELVKTTLLLDANRSLALKWVRKKYQPFRTERSARKVLKAWSHHVDVRHWADVDDDGRRTPSRSEVRRTRIGGTTFVEGEEEEEGASKAKRELFGDD